MKAETKFDLGQEVFFIHYYVEESIKKCTECDNGKITTTKGSVLGCPFCYGLGTFRKCYSVLYVAVGKIINIDVTFCPDHIPHINYTIDSNHEKINENLSRIENEMFATREEAEEQMNNLEKEIK